MVINKAVNAGTAAVTLATATAGQAIRLGGANAPGVLGLTQTELNQIAAGVLRIGSATAGNITIASPVTTLSGTAVLSLIDNGSISEGAFGSLAVIPDLRISSTGPVTLNNPNNVIGVLAADVTNALTVNDGINNLTVSTVDGDTGIVTSNSAINLTADAMTVIQQINAGTGIVTIAPFTATQAVDLGTNSQAGILGLTDSALGHITASVLRVDAINGNINVVNPVARHAGYNTLSLATGGGIGEAAALSVANLALSAAGNITLTNANNSVDTLAFTAGLAFAFTNASANALTIGPVDGIAQSSSGATTTISTGGNLTFASGLSSGGTATLTSTNGAIFDGDNGADVDVTAPTVVLQAATGIGSAAHPLQTQTGTLNATTGTGGIFINNGNAAPATLNIGNGGGGVQVPGASGDIVLTNNGTINSASNGNLIVGPGNVAVKALGANADLNLSGQQTNASVASTGSGLVDVEAGRDMTLGGGTANSFGAVLSVSGSIFLQAGRNFTINPNGELVVQTGTGGITASAGGNFTMATSPSGLGNAPFFQTQGGNIALSAGAGGTIALASTGTDAVHSFGGNISLSADNMVISQGVNAGTGNVLIQQVTAGELIGLGTASGTLTLDTAALNRVTAKTLTIGNAKAGAVNLAGAVAPAHVTNLTINTGSNFTALAASTLNIGAGVLTIGFDEQNLGATADLSGAAITAGTVIVDSGAGNDTFITGAGPEIINGGGGNDTAVFSGTLAQYAINATGGVVTVTKGGVTDTLTGIKSLHFSDQTIPAPQSGTPGGTTADLLLRETQGVSAGQVDAFDVGNNAIVSAAALGNLGSNWQVMGIGGFAGNPNEADLLMRDSNTGTLEAFDIASGQFGAAGSMGALGAEWQTFGVGNFSGNAGESDLVIHNTNNGGLFFLDIQHNQIVSLGSMGSIGAEWQSLGAGNFSSIPGETDILMRNTNNGSLFFLDIQHNQLVGLGSMGGIGLEWQNLGVGDFSGNANETDLLMRDTQNGAVDVFTVHGNQLTGVVAMGTIGAEWQSLGIGDLSGVPGEADLAMRNTQTGAIFAFDIQHNQFTAIKQMGTVGVDWQNLGVGSPLVPGSPLI